MILIITTTALAVICVCLAVALYLMSKKRTASRKAAVDTLMALAYLLKGVEEGIRKFNEEYDVQLKLAQLEEKDGYKKYALLYTDPKNEDSEATDVDNKPADTDTPEDK